MVGLLQSKSNWLCRFPGHSAPWRWGTMQPRVTRLLFLQSRRGNTGCGLFQKPVGRYYSLHYKPIFVKLNTNPPADACLPPKITTWFYFQVGSLHQLFHSLIQHQSFAGEVDLLSKQLKDFGGAWGWLVKKKNAIDWCSLCLRHRNGLTSPPGPTAMCAHSLWLLLLVPRQKSLPWVLAHFLGFGSFSLQTLLPWVVFLNFGKQAQSGFRGLGFSSGTFSPEQTRGGHAGESSAYIISLDKYDACPKTWHFTILTFYGAALCFKHDTALKESMLIQPPPQVPRVWLTIYGDGEKQSSFTWWDQVHWSLFEALLYHPSFSGWPGWCPWRSLTPRGWGKTPPWTWQRMHRKCSLEQQHYDRIIMISDEIMSEKMLCKP